MFKKFGEDLGKDINQSSENLKEAAPKIGIELGDKILKSSENLKRAAKEQSRGIETFGKYLKEGLIYSSLIVMGGMIINTILSKK